MADFSYLYNVEELCFSGYFLNFSAEKFGGIEILRIFAVLSFISEGERVRLMHRIRAFFVPWRYAYMAVRSPRDAVVMAVSVL